MVDVKQNIEKTPENIENNGMAKAPERINIPEKEGVIEDIYDKIDQKDSLGNQNIIKTTEGEGIIGATNAQTAYQLRQRTIEKTLEKGLAEEFLKMPKNKQIEFKQVGEETATRINELLDSGKVKAKKIIDLIKKWLMLIPGVNKFFIEQEAKIKADEILRLKNIDDL